MLPELDVAGFPSSWSLRHDRPPCQEAGTPIEVSESRNGPAAGARREGASRATPPPAIRDYFPQAQPSHLHTSQVQPSPVQLGHLQTLQPQAAAFVLALTATEQHALADEAEAGAEEAFEQPQTPHWHTSHVQDPPPQSGHRQSVQAQVDFDRDADEGCPAKAKA